MEQRIIHGQSNINPAHMHYFQRITTGENHSCCVLSIEPFSSTGFVLGIYNVGGVRCKPLFKAFVPTRSCLKSTETRKSQLYWMRSYGDLFYPLNYCLIYCYYQKFLLTARLLANFVLTARQ